MTMPTITDHMNRMGLETISPITFRCDTDRVGRSAVSAPGALGVRSFSMSVMIWANAKMPISTGRNGKPPDRNSEPKVKRGALPIGSVPITVMSKPMPVATRLLTSDASARPATMAIASTKRAKYSQGPNSSAMAASGPVTRIRNSPPTSPPKNEAHTPSHTARPGSPLRAIGKPSNVVAIADGVPGMPSRQAVISPPAEPPT